ncbi:hypothetical protein FE257_009821 [Aspergillus nanangensis]|uniref:Uncharacterized protein n=1 Tax=Aspergillus nanangensis TaxID=2582783 RepID=A0AAD4GTN4_ASPNN|nr:hypothetical protein FE257_009821 [Aspergillus nanangensis]
MARISFSVLAICFFLAVLSSALPTQQQENHNAQMDPYSDFTSEAIKSATSFMKDMNDDLDNNESTASKPANNVPAIPPMSQKAPQPDMEMEKPQTPTRPAPVIAEPKHEIVAPQEVEMPKPSSTPTVSKATPSASPSPSTTPSTSASATPVSLPSAKPMSPLQKLPLVGGIVGKLLPGA